MKKNKKKVIIILIIAVSALISFLLLRNIFNNKNKLTLEETKWIETNKYNVIDIAVMNDIPILSYNGEGLVYDFLNYVSNEHSLKFNIVPYKVDLDVTYSYKMNITDNIVSDDIVLLKDNLVLITVADIEYKDEVDIDNLTIGVHSSDLENLTKYFEEKNVQLVSYDNYSGLKDAIIKSKADYKLNLPVSIDGIIVPKVLITKEIIENNYTISYHLDDMKKYITLTKGNISNLNSILNKSYNNWESSYMTSYNKNLLNNYFKFNKVTDLEQKKLQSKSYVYGFIDFGVYSGLKKNSINGFNKLMLNGFNEFSNLSITYTKYKSLSRLLEDFNSNKVDFILDISDPENYKVTTYKTRGAFDKRLVIISDAHNKSMIGGINSLIGKEVSIIKDSYLGSYLIKKGIKVKLYNDMDDLTTDFDSNSISIVDLENYNYYKTSAFKEAKIDYVIEYDDKYSYLVNDNDENKTFEKLFDFYLNYNSINKIISMGYGTIAYENVNIVYILVIIIIILILYVVVDFVNHVKTMISKLKQHKKINLSKEDKIKYIDQLTSLKNRAYLNSKIEEWDETSIYPQAIIMIDLNNVAYINDNYGREEGDKVIKEAANILIQYQIQNSEIIRTDGNEFLIYLVGYNEKQIVSYLRKLNKELKNLSHGFGAASGYSIILDEIKTIDDAVNEATLEMKNSKEDIEY